MKGLLTASIVLLVALAFLGACGPSETAPPPAPTEEVQAALWFDCADEDCARCACGMRRDVEHPVDAVDEVEVGMAGWTEHGEVAPGRAAVGVGGGVGGATVGLCFDDAADHSLIFKDANQLFTDQRVGHEDRFPAVEAAGQGEGIQFDL